MEPAQASRRHSAIEDAKAKIGAIVREAMAKRDLKAVLAGVAFGDKPLLIEAWGESMTGVPATPDMHFRNGSVAIAYIGTVLLQLHDKGVLSLDDKLSKWFPDYPKADQITLKMLINGTSGYADYVAEDAIVPLLYADPFRAWQPDELIALALKKPMPCDPGTCWSYAHTNFVILGKVLEKASGRPLQDLIRAGILEPLSLKDTRSEMTAIIQEPVLHAFDGERGRYEDSTYWDPSWTLAEGAIMTSNIADILKSAAAIGEGTLVSPQSHAAQIAPETAKIQALECDRLLRLRRFRRRRLDHPEPVLRRLCRDHGVPSRKEARDRRIGDLEGKGIDERQSLDRPRQGIRRVSRARGALRPIADLGRGSTTRLHRPNNVSGVT